MSQEEIETNHDLIATYRHHITTTMNQANVSHFLRSFNSRSALEVERPVPGGNINARTLKSVPVVTFDTASKHQTRQQGHEKIKVNNH